LHLRSGHLYPGRASRADRVAAPLKAKPWACCGGSQVYSTSVELRWAWTIEPCLPKRRCGGGSLLLVTFKASNATYTVGPAEAVEFRGADVFVFDPVEPLATYRSGFWIYRGFSCATLECRGFVSVEFVDQAGNGGPQVGPRPSMRVKDRYAFAGRERLATLSLRTGEWFRPSREAWAVMRVVEQRLRR
jgi:hypothetical protein